MGFEIQNGPRNRPKTSPKTYQKNNGKTTEFINLSEQRTGSALKLAKAIGAASRDEPKRNETTRRDETRRNKETTRRERRHETRRDESPRLARILKVSPGFSRIR